VPDFVVTVKEFPAEMVGPLRWYAEVRSGLRVWHVTGPCASAAKARALAETWLAHFRPAAVRHVEAGVWELPRP
jgi:hypothetical protein